MSLSPAQALGVGFLILQAPNDSPASAVVSELHGAIESSDRNHCRTINGDQRSVSRLVFLLDHARSLIVLLSSLNFFRNDVGVVSGVLITIHSLAHGGLRGGLDGSLARTTGLLADRLGSTFVLVLILCLDHVSGSLLAKRVGHVFVFVRSGVVCLALGRTTTFAFGSLGRLGSRSRSGTVSSSVWRGNVCLAAGLLDLLEEVAVRDSHAFDAGGAVSLSCLVPVDL